MTTSQILSAQAANPRLVNKSIVWSAGGVIVGLAIAAIVVAALMFVHVGGIAPGASTQPVAQLTAKVTKLAQFPAVVITHHAAVIHSASRGLIEPGI